MDCHKLLAGRFNLGLELCIGPSYIRMHTLLEVYWYLLSDVKQTSGFSYVQNIWQYIYIYNFDLNKDGWYFFFLPLPSCSGWSRRIDVGFKVYTSHPYTGPPSCDTHLPWNNYLKTKRLRVYCNPPTGGDQAILASLLGSADVTHLYVVNDIH